MKKKGLLFVALCCMLSGAVFAACDDEPQTPPVDDGTTQETPDETPDETLKKITGVTMTDLAVTYDGNEHCVIVSGTVPEGVTVVYSDNAATDAGEYQATAVLSGEGYETLTLSATLTIARADLDENAFVFEGDVVSYDGEAHSLQVTGELPEGVTVSYTGNGQTEAGSYTVTAVLSGKNYNPLTLTAILRILPDVSQLAQSIVNAFGTAPDVWQFLPESFRLDASRATDSAMTNPDFSQFVSVAQISDMAIGKQLDVIYGSVIEMQGLMGYVNTFYAATSAIANLYQQYINANPDDYSSFAGSTSVKGVTLQFLIQLQSDEYKLLTKVGPASLEMCAYPEQSEYTGRVEIANVGALKFRVAENELEIGLNIIDRAQTMLQFVRNDSGAVTGYLYESLDVSVKTFGTTALLTWDGNENGTVSVAGENGDFFPGSTGRVVEMYDAATGKYLAGKVKEEILGSYDTYWFPIGKVSGITSVKAVKKGGIGGVAEGTISNPNEIYLNGSEDVFATKKVGGLGTDMFSRRFDIEMKTVYYYTYDAENDSFDKVKSEIPMLFVQEGFLEYFTEDVKDENKDLTLSVTVSSAMVAVLDNYYTLQLPLYDKIASLVTPEMVIAFIGTEDPYFSKTE